MTVSRSFGSSFRGFQPAHSCLILNSSAVCVSSDLWPCHQLRWPAHPACEWCSAQTSPGRISPASSVLLVALVPAPLANSASCWPCFELRIFVKSLFKAPFDRSLSSALAKSDFSRSNCAWLVCLLASQVWLSLVIAPLAASIAGHWLSRAGGRFCWVLWPWIRLISFGFGLVFLARIADIHSKVEFPFPIQKYRLVFSPSFR